MRAVKCKNGCLSIINRDEASLFRNIEAAQFVSVNKLNEREQYIAEEMYQRNVLQKVKRGNDIGYKIHPQKEKL